MWEQSHGLEITRKIGRKMHVPREMQRKKKSLRGNRTG